MRIAIFAVPYDAGRRGVGVGRGPARLLEAGIANELRAAGHDVREVTVDIPLDTAPHELARIVMTQRELGRLVHEAVAANELPLVLAGNCSTAVGTLAARTPDTAVVWFDAHGDFNTATTTTTGMVDGMALSMVTGRECRALTSSVSGFTPVNEDRVVLVGARDLDPPEEHAFSNSPVTRVTAGEAPHVITTVLRRLGRPAPPLYVHLDLDVLEPTEARANHYTAPHGLSRKALSQTLRQMAEAAPLYAVAITAYDPAWDLDGSTRQAAVDALHALIPRSETPE